MEFCREIIPTPNELFLILRSTEFQDNIWKQNDIIQYSSACGHNEHIAADFHIYIFQNEDLAIEYFHNCKGKLLKTIGLKCYEEVDITEEILIEKGTEINMPIMPYLITNTVSKWNDILDLPNKGFSIFNTKITSSIRSNTIFQYKEFIIVSSAPWLHSILFAYTMYEKIKQKTYDITNLLNETDLDDSNDYIDTINEMDMISLKKKLRRCAVCDKYPSNILQKWKICGKCKKKTYCSTECQTMDWPIHKQECSSSN